MRARRWVGEVCDFFNQDTRKLDVNFEMKGKKINQVSSN